MIENFKISSRKLIEISIGVLLSCLLYFPLSMHWIQRSDTYVLFGTFMLLGGFLVWIMHQKPNLKTIIFIGVLFRLLLVPYIPSLSQDFYRYLWDGSIQLEGFNPYVSKPSDLLNQVSFPYANQIYEAMGSLHNNNYSNYPPFSQWIYLLAAKVYYGELISPILILRLFTLLGEVLVCVFGIKLLKYFRVSPTLIGWFILNPLIILESFGNLHFEALMAGLCLAGLYHIFQNKLIFSSLFFSLAISTKLLPIFFLPVLFKFCSFKFFKRFIVCCGVFILITWIPYIDYNLISNYTQTLNLWFVNFEFNASLHYLLKEIHYLFYDFNIIKRIGPYTPFIIISIILLISFIRKNNTPKSVLESCLLILTIYFFISTTVHPWYIIFILVFGMMLGYVYTMIWSLTVLWSYWAYQSAGFAESLAIIAIEYGLVYSCFIIEMFRGPLLIKKPKEIKYFRFN
ncbi:MAG: polyprenol phosphomannose-dependent alpha 1,6 mannosyltransferase MptB [Flavobacteriaceae bacterium]|nr:polyprenol phosphomannose-dependent alpha 1,6 mannosyltransferase MptB [Flavobacteriaceae bacterium]MCY4217459.1 polyprenol phosphomannose-dependent alpha 1,6 mannosyltransferase MptB [Flavobacteriaceae bacterium]MCY4254223.1 polyprenol phosphomannose-dependent alpha 1,6 mannosyltransferase MptB [Flavobacteriaceae bacterium]